MIENVWIKNLKADINEIEFFQFAVEDYLKHVSNFDLEPIIVHSSIIKQFSDSLHAIIMLLNSIYKDSSTLITGQINNINGIFIYLRKIIEADMILNIVINNGEKLYKPYLDQRFIDESHISRVFGDSNNKFKSLTKEIQGKYYWLEKILEIRVNSIDDLIDIANIVPSAKSNMKAWVKECNYMSHPNLYSDNKIVSQFNGLFIYDIHYIFEVLIEVIYAFYEMIEVIESIPKYNSGYDVDLIKTTIPDLSLFKNDFVNKINAKFSNDNNFKQVDYNQVPYNIRAEFQMMTIGITSPSIVNDLGERKRKTLNKLIDLLSDDLRDLLIGYYHNINIIFYPKIRQVLEDLSYINQILKMTEDQIEIYQAYTDIQRYINANYAINVRKNYHKSPFDFKKQNIAIGDNKLTLEQHYQNNLIFIKKYFKDKYHKNVETKEIKRPNSWLYNGDKIPSNWQMIKMTLLDIKNSTHEDINFYSGLYSLSSLYCHVNDFSVTNTYIQKESTYVEFLRAVMTIVKTIYDNLMSFAYDDFKEIFKPSKTTLNKLMFDLYNYDIINVPNPN